MANENMYIPWSGWKPVKPIGHGSFGTVFEIEKKTSRGTQKAAMKVIPINAETLYDMYGSGYDADTARKMCEQELLSIRKEFDIMHELRGHPNVVRCDDFKVAYLKDGISCYVYIMMELLRPLQQFWKNRGIKESDVLRLGEDICNALITCEQHSLIHRDIKPQNILISDDGTYKLGDFGTARKFERTASATRAGTEMYMAPEIIMQQKYGRDVDTYSLGLVMYRMLNNGQMPFLSADKIPSAEDRAVALQRRLRGEPLPPPANGSRPLQAVVLKACSFDREDRYSSASEMLDDLMMAAEGTMPMFPATEKTMPTASDSASTPPERTGDDDRTAVLTDIGSGKQPEKAESSDGGNKPAKAGSSGGKKTLKIAVVAVFLVILAAAVYALFIYEPKPAPPPEDIKVAQEEPAEETEETPEATSSSNLIIDSKQEEELTAFLKTLQDCYGFKEGEGGSSRYYNTSATDFGVLQAIMYHYLVFDLDTYNDVCPLELDYQWLSTGDSMDPERKAAEFSISYIEANADAVNWIAENVFNDDEEQIRKELAFSSNLTEPMLSFYPLYESGGKYYYCPGQRGGPGYEIQYDDISIEEWDGEEYYIVKYTPGSWFFEGDVDWEDQRTARLQYKTENGKGYWSLYNDYVEQ